MKSKLPFLVSVSMPLAILVISLSGCGSSSSTTSTVASDTAITVTTAAATDTPTAAPVTMADSAPSSIDSAAAAGFQACLKKNGVDLPAGGLPDAGNGGALPQLPAGVDPAALQKAFGACQSELPAGAALPGGAAGAGGPGGVDISAFTTCLKDNGVNVPDNATPADIPTADPKFSEASKTCGALLPQLPGGAPGQSAATPTTVGN